MKLVNQNSPSLDTVVLDACDTIGTDMVVELHCLSLTSWNIRLQCVGQEFLLVPVHSTNNVNEKVYLAYATGHQLIQLH